MFKRLLGGKLTETLLTDLSEVLFYLQAFGIWYLEARVILVHNVLFNITSYAPIVVTFWIKVPSPKVQ